jgi:hypothetical protein
MRYGRFSSVIEPSTGTCRIEFQFVDAWHIVHPVSQSVRASTLVLMVDSTGHATVSCIAVADAAVYVDWVRDCQREVWKRLKLICKLVRVVSSNLVVSASSQGPIRLYAMVDGSMRIENCSSGTSLDFSPQDWAHFHGCLQKL